MRQNKYLFRLVAVTAIIWGAPWLSEAANGTWTGAADAAWTNSANWSASPYAGYNTVESARFDSAGNGNTTLDVTGLYSIWGLTFDTASVAAYTIGAGAPNSQTLVMGGNGTYTLTATAGASQTFNAKLQVGGSNAAGSYFFRNESATRSLVFAGDVTAGSSASAGLKTLSLYGAGGMLFSGNIYRGAATGVALTNGLAGTLSLTGSNTLQTLYLAGSGDTRTDIGAGFLALSNGGGNALYAYQGGAITGTGKLWLGTSSTASDSTSTDYANCYVAPGETLVIYPEITGPGGFEMYSGTGTFVLAGDNTFDAHVALNSGGTLSVSKLGNKGSVTSNLGRGGVIRFYSNGARLLYTGAGETTDRSLRLEGSCTIEHAGSGTLTFASDVDARGNVKTLTLQGSTDGVGVFAGAISNGTAATSLVKSGTGTWLLTGSNTYAGATSVSGGVLTVTGPAGALAGTGGITVSQNATLRLENDAVGNIGDRVRDTATVTLAGGTLALVRTGAISVSETLGAVTVIGSGSTLNVAEADEGQTSVLTLASIVRSSSSGTLNFVGSGLGASDRNRIFITGQPEGVIGPWATVNGSAPAAYSTTLGVYAGSEVAIAARGPSVLPDDASAAARITTPGEDGPITLAGDPASRIGSLQQESDTAAVVATAGKTLLANSLGISAGSAALTLGANVGDGTLMTLGAGAPLALNNDASSALTVNAQVADNVSASALAKNGAGDVILAGATTYTGPTAINNGTLTFAGHDTPQALSGGVSGNGALAKTGTNTLHLLASNTFTGAAYVNAGLVRANQNDTFGTAAGTTYIADGATLDLGCTPDVGGTRGINSLNLQTETITVRGAGLFGQGAIINSSTGSQWLALGQVALSGDATFTARSRWDIRDGSLTMNDHTVTKRGADIFSLSSLIVSPGPAGTAAFDVQEGNLRVQRTTDLGGSAANSVRIRSGAVIDFYDLAVGPVWTLALDGGSAYNIDNSLASSNNTWAGPVTLNGIASLTSDGTYHGGMSGAISGTGGLVKTNDHTFALSGTENTYSGPTRIFGGYLHVTRLRNVGQPSSLGQPLTVEDGTIRLGSGSNHGRLTYLGDGDTTDRVLDLSGGSGGASLNHAGTGFLTFSNMTFTGSGGKTLYLQGSTAGTGVIAGMITNAAVSGNVGVNKSGTGAWQLAGNNRYNGSTVLDGGTLAFTGNNVLAGSMTVNAGALSVSGQNTLSGNVTVNAGTLAYAGTNLLSGNLIVNSGQVTITGSNSYSAAGLVVGTTNRNATLTLTPGSSLSGSGDFRFGNPGGNGALYNNGCSILRTGSASDQSFVFGRDLSYGYLNMTAGSVTAGRFQMGGVNLPISISRGIARVSGGTLNFNEYVLLARNPGCETVLTLDGGTLNHSNAIQNVCLAFAGGRSEVNLTGGTLDNSGRNVTVNQNGGGFTATGIVNLCAGTLTTVTFSILPNSVAFLNFAGGTLRASGNATTFVSTNFTGVNVFGPHGAFAGGAVIDTAGFATTVPSALRAPAGQGVYAVAVAEAGAGYIGEPYVSIEGGGGVGATAVANLADDGTGSNTFKVASITVTCPGTGYTSAPTVLLKGGGYGVAPAQAGAATLAPNASGGLTKKGAGTLTLTGTNTYAGPTAIETGTLKIGSTAALPTGTRALLAGGTLDLGGLTLTNAVSGTGTLTNGTLRAGFSPGGEGAVATEALALTLRNATLQAVGLYRADLGASGTCDQVNVQGDINLSGLALSLVNPAALDSRYTYTLLTCTGTRTGQFSSANLPDGRWHLLYAPNGAVKLVCSGGTVLRVF